MSRSGARQRPVPLPLLARFDRSGRWLQTDRVHATDVRRFSFLFGAGFSKWAADLPLASGLFDLAITPHGPRERSRLDRLADDWTRWRDRNPDGHVEDYIADCHTSDKRQALAVWYVCRRLSEPFFTTMFNRRAAYMIDDRHRFEQPGIAKAQGFVQRCVGLDVGGIITTNYDLLLEYALGTKLFNYGTVNEQLVGRRPIARAGGHPRDTKPVHLRGHVPIAKLHGSLNWYPAARYTDPRGGVTGRALIVPPMPPKSMPPTLAPVWETARRALAASTDLLVFGFSFHERDTHIRELLGDAGRALRRVLLVDPAPRVDVASALWPDADVRSCGPDDRDAIAIWRRG